MTLQEFIAKYTGSSVEVGGSANAINQCVDLVNAYLMEVWNQEPIFGTNAVDFPSKLGNKYDFTPNSPTGIAPKGSVIVFKQYSTRYGSAGHIATVVSADINNVTMFEQNYPTGSVCTTHTRNYLGCVGWFILKDIIYKGYDLTNLDSMKVAVDILVQLQDGDLIRKEEVEKLLDEKEVKNEQELKDKISDLETKVATLNEAVAGKSLEINHLGAELETQERDNTDLGTQLGEARKQRDGFQTQAKDWQNKAENFEKGLNVAQTENNALKGQVSDLEKIIKDTKQFDLSLVDLGLLFQEIFHRFFKK